MTIGQSVVDGKCAMHRDVAVSNTNLEIMYDVRRDSKLYCSASSNVVITHEIVKQLKEEGEIKAERESEKREEYLSLSNPVVEDLRAYITRSSFNEPKCVGSVVGHKPQRISLSECGKSERLQDQLFQL